MTVRALGVGPERFGLPSAVLGTPGSDKPATARNSAAGVTVRKAQQRWSARPARVPKYSASSAPVNLRKRYPLFARMVRPSLPQQKRPKFLGLFYVPGSRDNPHRLLDRLVKARIDLQDRAFSCSTSE